MNASFFTSRRPLFAAALGCLAAAALPLPAACGGAPTDGATAYTITDLGTLPGGTESVAGGLNASGQVAGDSGVLFSCAFLYSSGKMTALGTLPGDTDSNATGINTSGQVVGESYGRSFTQHAFLYSAGTMKRLGALSSDTGSSAAGINASGQIVGHSYDSSDTFRAFLYSKGKMVDLTARLPAGSGWKLMKAAGINDSGQICGKGEIIGQTHAFLLTPSPGAAVRPLAPLKPGAAHK